MKVDPGAEIWQRIVELRGEITPSAVRALLKIEFSEGDHALMRELSTKARAGNLTPDEQAILDTLERLGCLLDIIHSKARAYASPLLQDTIASEDFFKKLRVHGRGELLLGDA